MDKAGSCLRGLSSSGNRPVVWSIGDIAFDPTDATNQTLMAGSGRFSSMLRLGGDRVGAFRTTDGGTTWTLLTGGGALAGLNISGVAPRGATLVLSANTADTLANRGVWRSTDTGATWTQISGAVGSGLPAGASFDLASDPSNNARLSHQCRGRDFSKRRHRCDVDEGQQRGHGRSAGRRRERRDIGRPARTTCMSRSSAAPVASPGCSARATRAARGLPSTCRRQPKAASPSESTRARKATRTCRSAADRTNASVAYIGGDRQPFLNEFTTGLCPCFPNSIGANDFSGRLFRVDASLAAGTQATHITHSNTGASS